MAAFDNLIVEGEAVEASIKRIPGGYIDSDAWLITDRGRKLPDRFELDYQRFAAWSTRCLSLFDRVLPARSLHREWLPALHQTSATPGAVRAILARLQAIRDDFDDGLLDDLSAEIDAALCGDLMGQAEQLLGATSHGQYNYIPAAVLVGAVLEHHLRNVAESTDNVKTTKPSGDALTLAGLIDELRRANVFNETTAKHLRAWSAVRNAAAHGEVQQITRNQVRDMITGVESFISDQGDWASIDGVPELGRQLAQD